MAFTKTLLLCTSHVPSPTPDWGEAWVREYEDGWIVFVPSEAPAWLQPIMEYAEANHCFTIAFSCGWVDVDTRFKTYQWPEEPTDLAICVHCDKLHHVDHNHQCEEGE